MAGDINLTANDLKGPQIGIFYFVPGKGKALSSGKVEFLSINKSEIKANNRGFVISKFLHIDYWEEIMEKYPQYKNLSYSYLPRGRVIYFEKNSKFYIVTDKCLHRKAIMSKIAAAFNIEGEEYLVEYEPIHYECYRCNKDLEPEDYYIG